MDAVGLDLGASDGLMSLAQELRVKRGTCRYVKSW